MEEIEAGMTSDEVLRRLGKPAGRSEVVGDEDPTVVWPYRHARVRFKYRGKAWRVVDGP